MKTLVLLAFVASAASFPANPAQWNTLNSIGFDDSAEIIFRQPGAVPAIQTYSVIPVQTILAQPAPPAQLYSAQPAQQTGPAPSVSFRVVPDSVELYDDDDFRVARGGQPQPGFRSAIGNQRGVYMDSIEDDVVYIPTQGQAAGPANFRSATSGNQQFRTAYVDSIEDFDDDVVYIPTQGQAAGPANFRSASSAPSGNQQFRAVYVDSLEDNDDVAYFPTQGHAGAGAVNFKSAHPSANGFRAVYADSLENDDVVYLSPGGQAGHNFRAAHTGSHSFRSVLDHSAELDDDIRIVYTAQQPASAAAAATGSAPPQGYQNNGVVAA